MSWLERAVGSAEPRPARGVVALAADRRGVAALEFAFIAPLLMTLLVGAMEFGRVMLSQSLIEGAVVAASRYGATGAVYPGQPSPTTAQRMAQIQQIVADQTFGVLDVTLLNVTVSTYANFAGVGQGGGINNNPGGANAVAVYDVTYRADFMTSFFAGVMGQAGISLSARAVVKNEPF